MMLLKTAGLGWERVEGGGAGRGNSIVPDQMVYSVPPERGQYGLFRHVHAIITVIMIHKKKQQQKTCMCYPDMRIRYIKHC